MLSCWEAGPNRSNAVSRFSSAMTHASGFEMSTRLFGAMKQSSLAHGAPFHRPSAPTHLPQLIKNGGLHKLWGGPCKDLCQSRLAMAPQPVIIKLNLPFLPTRPACAAARFFYITVIHSSRSFTATSSSFLVAVACQFSLHHQPFQPTPGGRFP
jgi:hypothetical protein